MKKITFALTIITFMAVTILVGCKSSTKEAKEAQENVQDAKDNLTVAKKAASDEQWKAFKENKDSIINENKNKIAEFKLKMRNKRKTIDAKYKENIDLLEQKNKDLKVKMEAYKNDASSDWESFKREFKHDEGELRKALKDLTINNVK